MALDPFIAKTVNPGEPVTAQAWNDIVQALAAMNQYLITSEASSVRVQVANAGIDPARVRVTAVSGDGSASEAVGPIPPGTEHVLSGLRPGTYTVRAEAPGFEPATANVTVPASAVVALTMAPRGAIMPEVFGKTLRECLAQLAGLGIAVARVVDISGRDIAPANPDPDAIDAPVLVQVPAPGDPVPPDGAAQLAGGAGALSSGADGLATGVGALGTGADQLATGTQDLATGAGDLAGGVGQLADGTTELAQGLGDATDQIPSYTDAERENLSAVVADPVAAPGVEDLGTGSTGPLFAVLALWLGALAVFVAFPPVPAKLLGSTRTAGRLALAALALPAGIAAATGLVVGGVLAAVEGASAGGWVGLLAVGALASVVFVALNQALAALLGNVGRAISLLVAVLLVATGIVATVPAALTGLRDLLPVGSALRLLTSIVDPGAAGGAGDAVALVLWGLASVAVTTLVVARRRSVRVEQLLRA